MGRSLKRGSSRECWLALRAPVVPDRGRQEARVRHPRDERGAQEASEQGPISRLNVPVPNFDGGAYQARFDALAEKGVDVHGEASLVRLSARHRCSTPVAAPGGSPSSWHATVGVVGVDLTASMIAEAGDVLLSLSGWRGTWRHLPSAVNLTSW